MARRYKSSYNPLPAHYEREMLDEQEPIRFRERNVSEGRGNNWVDGLLLGWDTHCTEEPCAIVYAKEGGFRTLNPTIWEFK